MVNLSVGLKCYLWVTCAYGLAHSVQDVWALKTNLYGSHVSKPDNLREMMLVDKFVVVVMGTVSSSVLWPLLLRDDLIRLECLVRGKQVKDYLHDEL
jgi:hypothetical protein